MRHNLRHAAVVTVVLLVACGGGEEFASLGPPPEASPTGNAPAPPTDTTGPTGATGDGASGSTGSLPTTSPGITGSVTEGNATLAVTGSLQTTQPTLPLVSPAIYAPPPGTFALNWATAAAGFAVGGTSFVGTRPTSSTLRLTLFVHSASGTASFSSSGGECQITVTQAAVSSVAGTFACTGLTDPNGTLVVDALGSFSASG